MAQYRAVEGTPTDWHLVHLAERAKGGAGLIFTEMTCVSPQGRITPGCTGLYASEHEAAWQRFQPLLVHTELSFGKLVAQRCDYVSFELGVPSVRQCGNPALAKKTLRSTELVSTYGFPDFLAGYPGSFQFRFYGAHIGEFNEWIPERKSHAAQHPEHQQVNAHLFHQICRFEAE
jgi:hypothetical protein